MWKLDKPNMGDAKNDLNKAFNAHHLVVTEAIKIQLKQLYDSYENGLGYVSDIVHNKILVNVQNAIHGKYKETYKGGILNYIRLKLFSKVDKCPYCSIGEPQQLDHFMPQAQYKALSICRNNLVPLCATCNNKKRDDKFSNYIHPYYQIFPANVIFLVASVTIINNRVKVYFNLDFSKIYDKQLQNKLKYQFDHLEMNERLAKSTNCFLAELLNQNFESQRELKSFLKNRLQDKEQIYKLNDWRCAVIRGLVACQQFTYNIANCYIKTRPIDINVGAGA